MNITTRAKALVGALAIGGAAVAMGGAFTAGGLDATAAGDGFVGGTDSQTITGATLSSVVYDVDDANDEINSVTLTFGTGASGKAVAIAFSGGTTAGFYTCENVGATTADTSTCTFDVTKASSDASSLDITVESE